MDRDLLLTEYGQVRTAIGPFKSDPVRTLAATFDSHLETTVSLLRLPLFLILVGELKAEDMVHFTAAVTEGGSYRTFTTSVETQRAVYQRARELAAESDKDPAVLEHRDLHISASVDRILGQPGTQQALVSLVYAAVAFLWTAFESVCRDAWTTALNARGVTLAQRILGELRRDDGDPDISRRQISVGLLAQYGFDLRDHLGTALASKFDFSSVKGTKVAYEAAFGKDSDIAAAIDSRVIQELEDTRHVIVHNAGRVDAAYIRRSGSSAALGSTIEVSAEQIVEYLRGVEVAGGAVLGGIDSWLAGEEKPHGTVPDDQTAPA